MLHRTSLCHRTSSPCREQQRRPWSPCSMYPRLDDRPPSARNQGATSSVFVDMRHCSTRMLLGDRGPAESSAPESHARTVQRYRGHRPFRQIGSGRIQGRAPQPGLASARRTRSVCRMLRAGLYAVSVHQEDPIRDGSLTMDRRTGFLSQVWALLTLGHSSPVARAEVERGPRRPGADTSGHAFSHTVDSRREIFDT